MIKPAICYKQQIEDALKEYFYTDDMMFYMGCINSYLIKVSDEGENGKYEYAVVDSDGRLVGYIAYTIDYYSSCVYNFAAFSFERGNPIMGEELFNALEKILGAYHRVEFRAIGGNPAIRGYDHFLKRHEDIGRKHILKDCFKDACGNYHDVYIYEFVNVVEEEA